MSWLSQINFVIGQKENKKIKNQRLNIKYMAYFQPSSYAPIIYKSLNYQGKVCLGIVSKTSCVWGITVKKAQVDEELVVK